MTIRLGATLGCDADGCDAVAVVYVYLRRDRHLDSGNVAELELPNGWTREHFGLGGRAKHRCPEHPEELL